MPPSLHNPPRLVHPGPQLSPPPPRSVDSSSVPPPQATSQTDLENWVTAVQPCPLLSTIPLNWFTPGLSFPPPPPHDRLTAARFLPLRRPAKRTLENWVTAVQPRPLLSTIPLDWFTPGLSFLPPSHDRLTAARSSPLRRPARRTWRTG